MEIKYAIHSVNENPAYLDFWPIVSKLWKTKFNITPILVYISKTKLSLCENYGTVVQIAPIADISTTLQAQWARYWYTQFLNDDIAIISDIDMLPLSKRHFLSQLQMVDDNTYVHLNACVETYGALPACYHIAKGLHFKKMLELDKAWETSIQKLLEFNNNLPSDCTYHLDKGLWFADERYSTYQILNTSHGIKQLFLKTEVAEYRIDRINWYYNKSLLKYDHYIDCHSLRPYSKHKKSIDQLTALSFSAKIKSAPIWLVQIDNLYKRLYLKWQHLKNSRKN